MNSPGAMMVASYFFVAGLGQIYNGQILKGFLIVTLFLLCYIFVGFVASGNTAE